MNQKSNIQEVEKFLAGIRFINSEHYEMIVDIRAVLYDSYPEVTERIQFGGIVFYQGKRLCCGLFSNKHHLTLEFSNGYLFKDPDGLLQGKGKYRRHLKLVYKKDIPLMHVGWFIKQEFTI